MDTRKFILQETLFLTLGEGICLAATWGVFYLLNRFSSRVVLGGILGLVLAVGNFFFLAIGANAAADQAQAQNVSAGQKILRSSRLIRSLILLVLLAVFAKSGRANLIAMALPLFLARPILTVTEFFRKSGA